LLLTRIWLCQFGVELEDDLGEQDAERVLEAVREDLHADGDHDDHPSPATLRVVMLREGKQVAQVGKETMCGRAPFGRLAAAAAVSGVGGRRPRVLEPRAGRTVLLQKQTVRQRVRAVQPAELGGAARHPRQTVILVIQHRRPCSPSGAALAQETALLALDAASNTVTVRTHLNLALTQVCWNG
jgi:hypothetical protein